TLGGHDPPAHPFRTENTTPGRPVPAAVVPTAPAPGGAGPLPPNQSPARQYAFTLPRSLDGAGQLRFTVTTNYQHQVTERNNDGTADGNNTARVTATSSLVAPDLQVANLRAEPATGLQSGRGLIVLWRAHPTPPR